MFSVWPVLRWSWAATSPTISSLTTCHQVISLVISFKPEEIIMHFCFRLVCGRFLDQFCCSSWGHSWKNGKKYNYFFFSFNDLWYFSCLDVWWKKRNNFLFKHSFILVPDRTKDKVRKVFWEYFKLWPKSLNSATAKTNFSTLFADRYVHKNFFQNLI